MKSIANIIHLKNFPLFILDDQENTIYYETSNEKWWKSKFDKGYETYCENSDGYWWKGEYNDRGTQIHYENSDGDILDNRP